MKKKLSLGFLFLTVIPFYSSADVSLKDMCAARGYTFIENVKVKNYNTVTNWNAGFNEPQPGINIKVEVGGVNKWYGAFSRYEAAEAMREYIKILGLTQFPVDICVTEYYGILFGIQNHTPFSGGS